MSLLPYILFQAQRQSEALQKAFLPTFFSEKSRLTFLLGGQLHALAVVQDALAQAQVLGGALQQLIVRQELQALLQAHLLGGRQAQGVVGAGSAHVGQLLLLAHVDGDVLALGVSPTIMPA